ncbi:MAG: bifunctional phosphoribosylaminoimidazolecarboxamide formyltransferase/IMP cyclohydrolase [Ktedonobacterales bacterium]
MRALLSVANKMGIETLARGLIALGAELISTGGTAKLLTDAGIPVRSVADVTGFPEILEGRVKTLHPAISGAILARRDDAGHMAELAAHGIAPIDLVVCNLYPFAETIATPDVSESAALEEIDIGGVTLLRAAAKNFPHVTVVVRPQDYEDVLTELTMGGATTPETRKRLAAVAFQHTALYDTHIAEYLRRDTPQALLPEEMTLGLSKLQALRYGENPHQQAALYAWGGRGVGLRNEETGSDDGAVHASTATCPTIAGARLLHGKELSFNNLLDLDAALSAVASFTATAAVVVKHTNPCGLACGDSLADAYRRAHGGDPVSAYGGILGFNREVDAETARLLSEMFYEAILAPSYAPDAMAILTRKKNLRLLATNTPIGPSAVKPGHFDPSRLDVRRVSGGLLLQTEDIVSDQEAQCKVVTEREPTLDEVTDMLFAWKVVRHVKSNAIVLAKKLTVVGVGAGQMNRVYSVQIAVDRAADRARGSVLASDAYFPFADGVEVAAKAGVTAIIQPGGSIRDDESVRMANRYGVAMLITGQRHFRH